MRKVQSYFESLGFSGKDLEKILNAFELRHFNKNDFLVEEGKISRHIGPIGSQHLWHRRKPSRFDSNW